MRSFRVSCLPEAQSVPCGGSNSQARKGESLPSQDKGFLLQAGQERPVSQEQAAAPIALPDKPSCPNQTAVEQ